MTCWPCRSFCPCLQESCTPTSLQTSHNPPRLHFLWKCPRSQSTTSPLRHSAVAKARRHHGPRARLHGRALPRGGALRVGAQPRRRHLPQLLLLHGVGRRRRRLQAEHTPVNRMRVVTAPCLATLPAPASTPRWPARAPAPSARQTRAARRRPPPPEARWAAPWSCLGPKPPAPCLRPHSHTKVHIRRTHSLRAPPRGAAEVGGGPPTKLGRTCALDAPHVARLEVGHNHHHAVLRARTRKQGQSSTVPFPPSGCPQPLPPQPPC